MSPIIVISIVAGVILLLVVVGLPTKVFRWMGLSLMKLLIGALFLFFLNAIGNQFGLAVPINFITSAISGFLGLPGVAALAIIQLWIF
ncbi:pro-sigmaK processing inhibitor BofA family protein [Bacillus sp. SD088]|uniref:pro-sigmaK processing inhibitor BofA family protein n=1 Tax=Bacillus sp. SD088 TaxID=2782012 RepID=UPI001A970053|nr:pro-sigmaK processing inhibitor BofA family protein [Bacillus sp. SD088]MBO0995515.1 pro-sigmaK processing inhibitor BofA family protein [Bacillus sp. SD088]